MYDGFGPFEWGSILVVYLYKRSMASRGCLGEVKLAPRKADRLKMLNQHSTWFSQELYVFEPVRE